MTAQNQEKYKDKIVIENVNFLSNNMVHIRKTLDNMDILLKKIKKEIKRKKGEIES